jgi:hypothetical protein
MTLLTALCHKQYGTIGEMPLTRGPSIGSSATAQPYWITCGWLIYEQMQATYAQCPSRAPTVSVSQSSRVALESLALSHRTLARVITSAPHGKLAMDLQSHCGLHQCAHAYRTHRGRTRHTMVAAVHRMLQCAMASNAAQFKDGIGQSTLGCVPGCPGAVHSGHRVGR